MELKNLLILAREKKASDLHLAAGIGSWLRIDGILSPIAETPIFSDDELRTMLLTIMDAKIGLELQQNLEVDFACVLGLDRFRVNVFQQQHGIAASFRIIPQLIPSLEKLQLPSGVQKFTQFDHGLVLITGPTGSGKTTTLASMIDFINKHESRHIITIEDPIEFIHVSERSLINQRQVLRDTKSFSLALRASLREDPDILLIGELRDLVTIRLALTAAETGHLVFATLHTASSAKTINRIVDVFPGNEQPLVRTMLADSLRGVIAQILCRRKNSDGRIAATEILVNTPAIANLIRENKVAQIYSQLQMGTPFGMHTMEQNLASLAKSGIMQAGY